ncbi:flagellar protein FlgN [Lachnospira pectinoschiza]|uniref:flagellar export chaperone FlgN n=1 Tax=Lachnospira TaxID=28050 RepID=UPI001D07D529|nr:flagellar export chaperone FlgN [Lachnospira pectinoschiza]MCB6143620.1 flagellar protein FlgN [Lachnospira pectinoschiza]
MDTQNYVDIMIDSLTKKEELLKQIVDYNEAQQTIVTAPEFKEEAFEKNVADKGEVVEKILRLDEGFNSVFNRIKEELQNNKKKYAKDIERLKTLVASVTDLGVRIQAQELRNKQLVEKRFAQMRKELSQAKRTTSTANAYYKNVNNLNQYESHFLDQKK